MDEAQQDRSTMGPRTSPDRAHGPPERGTADNRASLLVDDAHELCRQVTQAMDAGAFVVDSSLCVLAVNPTLRRWCEQWGWDCEPVGKELSEAFPSLPEGVRQEFEAVVQTGRPMTTERTLTFNGREFTFESSKTPILWGQRAVGVVMIIRDITARRQAERALAYRLDLDTLVMRISSDFIALPSDGIDRGILSAMKTIGEFVSVDRSSVFVFSEDGAEVSITLGWCADGIAPIADRVQHLPTEHTPWWTAKLRRDEVIHVPRVADLPPEAQVAKAVLEGLGIKSALAVPMFHGKKILGFLGLDMVRRDKTWTQDVISLLRVVADIFANALHRKRTEAALRQSEEQFRQIAENVRHGMWIQDARTTEMLYVSREAARIIGQDVEALTSDAAAWRKSIHPEDDCGPGDLGGKSVETEYRVIHDDGTIHWISDLTVPIHDEHGQLVRIAGIIEDITERKEADEALRQAYKKLLNAREAERRRLARELHDTVSQDLVAMQVAIQNAAAAGQGILDRHQMHALLDATGKCTHLVRDVRNICQGLYPATLETLGLVAALRQLGQYCQEHVEFTLTFSPGLDKQRFGDVYEIALYRIAQQAVNNALQHADAQSITLGLEGDDSEITLEVIDDGCGFDPDQRAGRGLGLTTMNDRAKAAGGELSITSEPGRTCVKVHAVLDGQAG